MPKTKQDELKALWYKKLADSGFNDIEQDEDRLKFWSSKFATKQSQERAEAKEAYYRMATHFLNDYIFETPLEKVIWEYHAEGISVREISKTLNKVRAPKSITKDTVWRIVSKLETSMKRMYLPSYE